MLDALASTIDAHRVGHLVVERHAGDFEELEAGRDYDLVLSVDSWYHLGRTAEVLAEALAMRRAGGHSSS